MTRRRRMSRRSRRNPKTGLQWTATVGGLSVADPEITPNQFWVVGVLTDDEFERNTFASGSGYLQRIRGELFLLPSMQELTNPATPLPTAAGVELATVYTVGVVRLPEDDALAAGSWFSSTHDGANVNPRDPNFYVDGADVLWRGLYYQRMVLSVDGEDSYWTAQNGPLTFDVKVHRKLSQEDSLYFFVDPYPSAYFARGFAGALNVRTLFRSSA